MSSAAGVLRELAEEFSRVIPAVDAVAEHERWKPGIGPFEEENQLAMILEELADGGQTPATVRTEVTYPDSRQQCDLLVERGGH